MSVVANLALFLIPLLAAGYILVYRASPRSVAIAAVFGWLYMPLLRFDVPGLPMIDKESLLGAALFFGVYMGRPTGKGVRLRWFDWPLVAWCLSSSFASLSNDLGLLDAISGALRGLLQFGAPYAAGRMVFVDAPALVEFGRAMVAGAASYAPLCLIEARLAPRLHEWVYGMPGRVGWETVDFYGPLRWKASVFLQSPLELTPLMGLGFLFAWWMSWRMNQRVVGGYSLRVLMALAAFAMLMGKALGGVSVTLLSMGVLLLTRRTHLRWFAVAALSLVPLYIGTRASGSWDALNAVQFIADNISERRAESFKTRIDNENILVVKALERPMFGWGGWGRSRVYDEDGRDISITDGFWVIVLGVCGWFGLASWLLTMGVACAWVLGPHWYSFQRSCGDLAFVPCAMMALLMHSLDSLANSMANPIYYLLAGSLISIGSLMPVARHEQLRERGPDARNLQPRTDATPVADSGR